MFKVNSCPVDSMNEQSHFQDFNQGRVQFSNLAEGCGEIALELQDQFALLAPGDLLGNAQDADRFAFFGDYIFASDEDPMIEAVQ